MNLLSDHELLDELKRRFTENKTNLEELHTLTSQLKEVNEKLMKSEKLKSDFLSNIRNEINNPLTAILGITENIMMDPAMEPQSVQEMVEMIHHEAFNLDFQMRTIFAAAEIEAGEARIHVSRVNVEELVKRVLENFERLTQKKGMSVNFVNDISEGAIFFKTDAEKIHLILSNLVRNAIEFSHESGQMEIRTWLEKENLIISIQDFGIGIDEKEFHRIFDRFVQLDSGATKAHQGHGLGLSVTKGAVDLLGGSISVSSQLNQGSTFIVTLPPAEGSGESEPIAYDGNEEIF